MSRPRASNHGATPLKYQEPKTQRAGFHQQIRTTHMTTSYASPTKCLSAVRIDVRSATRGVFQENSSPRIQLRSD